MTGKMAGGRRWRRQPEGSCNSLVEKKGRKKKEKRKEKKKRRKKEWANVFFCGLEFIFLVGFWEWILVYFFRVSVGLGGQSPCFILVGFE